MNNSQNYGQKRGASNDQQDRIDLNNYMPDPSKKNDLKKRLYDSGISNIPMPSVKREIEENISSRPFSAKMNPNKIQSLSKVKNNIDNITKKIYSNLQDSYKEAAQIEAKYKGEGTAEYYKSQHITVPPPQVFQPKKGSTKLVPKIMQNNEGAPVIAGMASTNKILLNKCSKPNQLPSLSDYGRQKQMGQTQLDPTLRLLQGPPSIVMAGFEGGYSLNQKNLELARSKFLLDKLTNKLPPELRGGRAGKLPPLDSTRDGIQSHVSQISHKSVKQDGTGGEEEETKKDVVQQKWSNLDKYIEILLDSKSEEETVFVYLNPNPNGDPYDLLVCTYQERNPPEYYTLSGKGLTHYERDNPVEFISLGQWLIERDSYNQIKDLDFFKKFKKWKFMRMWKKTIKHQNRMKAQNSLEEKLFMLQPHFSEHLSNHRKFMIDMESKRFINPCNTGDTCKLEEFAQKQVEQTEAIAIEISRFSDKCRENIRYCISKVLSELRTRIVSEIALDEQRKKSNPIGSQTNTITMKRKESSNVFEKLGFPEGMTYGHRSSLRKECSRFLRFAYLVDFLTLESLANIYTGSVRDMINRLQELDVGCDIEQVINMDYSDQNNTGAQRGSEPLFYVSVQLCDENPIPESEIQQKQIDEFVLPPRGNSKVQDFDPLAHLELEEIKEGEEEEEAQEEEQQLAKPIFQKIIPRIENYWLRMEPDQNDYIEVIMRTFQAGLDQIKNFERWSKHHDLTPYANALEEWDDIVGDSWEEPDNFKLDPKSWITDDPLFNRQKDIVSEILQSAFSKMSYFLKRFQPLLEIYWRNKQIQIEILVDEQLKNPVESLQNIIKLFNYQHELFTSSIPHLANIGLIQLDAKSARNKIQPTPKKYLAQLEGFIPVIIRERNEEAKKWLVQCIRNLNKPVGGVEEFVEQNQHYNYINENFQNYRDKVDLINQIYNVLNENNLKIRKEDKDLLNESMSDIQKLNGIVQLVESEQEKNKEVFKKTLNELIPKLDKEINLIFDVSKDPKYLNGDNMEKMFDVLKDLSEVEAKFKTLEEESLKYNRWQEVLETQPTVFENLDAAREEITLRCLMWRSLQTWTELNEKWYKTKFSSVDQAAIAVEADKYFKISMRLEKNLEPNPIQEKLKIAVTTFKDAMPIVKALRNEKLTSVHMDQIKDLIKKDLELDQEDFTLKKLIDLDVNQFQEEIVAISTQATQEANLKTQLSEIDAIWKLIGFNVHYEEKCDCYIVKDLEEIYTALDESLSQINMILGSRFVKPLRVEAEKWKNDILNMSTMVDLWISCQRQYLYLENIFKQPDLKKSMPDDSKAFDGVEKQFKQIMLATQKQSKLLKLIQSKPDKIALFDGFNKTLEKVQKALDDYMEEKRTKFPRFYFLSNDELIDILANSQNIDVIQQHLKTLFDNIVKIDLQEDTVEFINSSEKEQVQLTGKPVKTRNQIEVWLMNLQDAMIDSLSKLMKEGYKYYSEKPRKDFVLNHKGQIVATVCQIMWTQLSEEALNDQSSNPFALQEWYDSNVTQIIELTELVRGQLGDLQRKIIVALVTVDVHARDIIEELKNENVSSAQDFRWQKQLRYSYEENEEKNVKIRQVSALMNYAYEYMGATSRLVITPLTDRCWITISNALHIKLGANPAGPAGTGKTESTKDLAKAIAIQCIVFNCSDQVDYQMMGRLFSGLCQQGCWTCLDEFNRIDIEVLSVIAQQLLQIRNALLLSKDNFTFEEKPIPLKPEFGCHVTMNPGYAGRTELPDNLQVMFRPVAMMIPDYGLIAEIMLGAEGFGNAKILSKKMVQLYKLSSEQLSQQDHYDFGLRAVKSVLVMAGGLKRANPDLIEDGVLIRAMRDANVPKFLKDDLPLFAGIIQDLFPGIEITENDYGKLLLTIEYIVERKELQKHKVFISKVLQLYETFNVRFGVMLVGPTGSGKTACYNVLQDTFIYLREQNDPDKAFQFVKKEVLNPKSISMGEMYGEIDEQTMEWADGLASKIMRLASQETSEDRTWVVFDGPVDALWIENMNTVLDDNMTLCLANGQRIKLRSQMRMLFEVQDLSVASPATVSRCGMVYMTPEQLGWRPYVKTWIKVFFEQESKFGLLNDMLKEYLYAIYEATVDLALDFIRANCKESIKTTDLQQVVSLCNFLEYFIDESRGFKGTDEEKKKMLDCLFAWSYAWGIGASLDQKGKERFDSIVREQFKSVQFPQSFTVFDYFYELKKERVFKPWTVKVPQFVYDKDLPYFDLMVPTTDTTKFSFALECLLAIQRPCFFTGESGVGKSSVIAYLLAQLKEKDTTPIIINMSAQTTSKRTQQSIEAKLEKKKRQCFGAQPGKRICIFVDDINMPSVEEYGAQPPIELLRLFLDKQGMYQRGEWIWNDVVDTTLVACAAPPGGGRAQITPRFTRIFNMMCLPQASQGTLATIFGSIIKGFLGTGFTDKVKNLEDAAVSSTIEIYFRIQDELRPTPSKFHYLFNLRDVSKVMQGICMTRPISIQNEDVFMRLWVNESFRVFYDRLINDEDRNWMKELMGELISKNFKMSPDKEELFEKLRFGDLLKLDAPVQLYEYITDKPKLLKTLHGSLDEYNMGNSNKMNLVLFDDALEHILKIARCLKQPRGHIMLIGVGGSGKQSLIRLCTFMRGMELKNIELFKGYKLQNFLEFMKGLMKQSGITGTGISFVMTDTQIISESFIENLNNLLNTGEIPNLMQAEDVEEINNGVRPVCIERKIVDTIDNIQGLFISRVRENLHICLCMSPVGETLRIRCRQFPSLVNCCLLDWFSRWPEQALLFVSSEFLKELPDTSEPIKAGLSEMCMRIHTSVETISEKFFASLRRRVYTTPKSYLDLISLYMKVLEQKRIEFNKNKNRLAIGLKKLNDTNTNIAELKIKLTQMQPILEEQNKQLAVALVKVNADKEIADQKEKSVSAEAEIVNKKASEAKAIADDAEADLAAAKPELAAAQNAVKNLDKNAIIEIKSFAKPPGGVLFVMQCIMVLLGEKTDWDTVKKVLGNVGEFMGKLLDYNVEETTEKTWKKARDGWISKPDFDPVEVKKVSSAAASLCIWATASSRFQAVTKKVAPKKAKYAEVKQILEQAQSELKVKLDLVESVKAAVAKLEAECQKMQDDKEQLEFDMDRSQKRMMRAEKLVVLLKDEGVRWKSTVELIAGDIERLVGNVFISCACISYFGGFTGEYREQLVSQWVQGCVERGIPTSDNFSLVSVMGDPVVIRGWNIAGLPSDQVSTENGILTMKAERYALCIDPQQQANKWLRNMEKDNNLSILKFGTDTFLREVTAAVRNGKPCLVQDVEEFVDPAIDSILLKQSFKTDSGIWQIRLGDANVDYDENFNFFMTTKMPNPHYIPEICIKVTLINFTVTFEGLEQQLLGDVVIAEKPEVEAKRDEIVLTMAADAKTLKDLENNILKLLSEATLEQILDEDTLIEILENSKQKSTEINGRMEQSKIVEVEINETRKMYNKVSVRGSILYFVISDLAGIDPMYQNSLTYIKMLFNKAISLSPQAPTIDERLDILIDNISRIFYTNISRGLFERDKLIYSFLIATSIKKNANQLDIGIWNVFLRGPTIMSSEEKAAQPMNPDPEIIPQILWDSLYSAQLRCQGQFDGLCQHVCDNWILWQEWSKSANPYITRSPGDFDEKISLFDKLMLVRTLRPELVQQSIADYIIKEMTEFYIEPPSTQMAVLYENISTVTPLIFVLSKGADPTTTLYKFAQERDFGEKINFISLGQGQDKKAAALIKSAKTEGTWVMLQNCHLMKSWMPDLEKIVLDFSENPGEIHDDFRLYLTSMPADYFPVAILQNSVKLTTEPPRGMRANLNRSYTNIINQEYLDNCLKPEIWRKIIFCFSFFHAQIQERRKFGPLGWNIKYEFNDSDLETSFVMLKLFLDSPEEIPWDALLFVTGHINYGGRVTDDNDRKCLLTILEKFCQPECLKEGYKFSQSGTYFAPPDGKLNIYKEYIESLPLNDLPEIFGLHENANIKYQNQESSRVIQTVLSIQPRVSSGSGGMTPDQVVLEQSKYFLNLLPAILDRKDGDKDIFTQNAQGLLPSLTTVLLQEIEKFNKLLNKMRQSLIDIDKAINGFIVMSAELDSMYVKIQNNQVPNNWANVSYLSLKPLSSWFVDMIQRVAFIENWLKNGNPNSYWMPGLFFPQGFLTGVLQTHARQYLIAIDKLQFYFEVTEFEKPEEISEKPEDGVYINGLYLDGARWDRNNHNLEEQYPSRMFDPVPIIWFKPVDDFKVEPDEYLAPLYKASSREGKLSTTGASTNFVLHVTMPTKAAPSHWTLRAAALLCMLDD